MVNNNDNLRQISNLSLLGRGKLEKNLTDAYQIQYFEDDIHDK